ncbi:hypothetical protein [Streptomyces sp. NPDC017673]|uniref:hypothetical protein n=1 Tax=unclassified Streptomyces TaxID=2593676 RepID=UPI0037A249F8
MSTWWNDCRTLQIDLCLDAGVNLVDIANTYSAGVAEEILGHAPAGGATSC